MKDIEFTIIFTFVALFLTGFFGIKNLPKPEAKKACAVVQEAFRQSPFLVFFLAPGEVFACGPSGLK